jgi:G:T-mismatch repair DNA endonuclease (very short patch repair protein)
MHSSKTTKEFRQSCSPFSLEFYRKKYPNLQEEEYQSKLDEFLKTVDYDNRLTETNLEYWVEKNSGDIQKAKEDYKNRQNTFTLEKCISKYGEEKGTIVYNERQEKWQTTLSKNGNKCGWSKISQELFETLNKPNARYGTNGGEISMYNGTLLYLYDYVYDNKIIEYNGDQYHANPNKYGPDDMSHPYRKGKGYTAKDIWEKDKKKIDFAKSRGYEVLVVWDSDYRKDKEGTIQKCLDFLKK